MERDIILCPECRLEIAKTDTVCPHCGFDLKYAEEH